MLNIPLMSNNISHSDIEILIDFLRNNDRFTNGPKVREFEKAWSDWIGMKYSVFVNSGSSANFITLAAIRELYGSGDVIVSPLGWSSDLASILAAGMNPVVVDVELSDLAMREEEVLSKINDNTKAILLTHVLGYDGMKDRIQSICREKGIILVEDVCESHGATHNGKKCGTFGTISNFSFYYAHHMSTIEGGMICTDDREIYRMLRMFRSHGMLRECDDPDYMDTMSKKYEDIYPEFIFMVPGYNMRSTELNAVIGLNQLKRLDENVKRRRENYDLFLSGLNKEKYYTDFKHDGNSNYAFVILLRKKYKYLYEHVVGMLKEENVEFRRGTAGGGNLTRQPFLKKVLAGIDPADFVNVDYIHHYGLYTGNYPDLPKEKIMTLTQLLNDVE